MRRASQLAGGLAAAVATVALAGCGGGDGEDAGDPVELGSLAALAPEDSFLYAEAVVRPTGEREESLREVVESFGGDGDDLDGFAAPLFENGLDDVDDAGDVDYSDDVEPWLGERVAGFATRLERDLDGEPSGDGALIISTTDPEAAEQAASEVLDGETETYLDTEYVIAGQAGYAMLDDNLVVGDDPGIRAAIEASQGTGFGGSESFDAAIAEVPDHSLGLLMGDAAETLTLQLTSPPDPLTPAEAQRLIPRFGIDTSEPFAIAVGSEDGDVDVRESLTLTVPPDLAASETALAALPSDAAFGAADSVLQQVTLRAAVEGFRLGLEEAAARRRIPPGELSGLLERRAGADLLAVLDSLGQSSIAVLGDESPVIAATVATSATPDDTLATARFLLESSGAQVQDDAGAAGVIGAELPGLDGAEVRVAAPGGRLLLAAGEDETAVDEAISALAEPGQPRDLSQFVDQLPPGYTLSGYGELDSLAALIEGYLPGDDETERIVEALGELSLVAGVSADGNRVTSLLRLTSED